MLLMLLLLAPYCVLQKRNFRGNTFLQLLKSLLIHQTKSNTLLSKTQAMSASRKSEDLVKRTPLNKMGAPSATGITLWLQTQTTLGFSLLPNLAHPASCGMLILPTSSGSNTERDTCTSEFLKRSPCMTKRNTKSTDGTVQSKQTCWSWREAEEEENGQLRAIWSFP